MQCYNPNTDHRSIILAINVGKLNFMEWTNMFENGRKTVDMKVFHA